MRLLPTICIVSALLIELFIFPQYTIGGCVRPDAGFIYIIPFLIAFWYVERKSSDWKPLLIGASAGWLVASIMSEQWLAPFPQIHWFRSLGIDTGPIALHLFSAYILLVTAFFPTGSLQKLTIGFSLIGLSLYWILPQQFLYENITPATQNISETLIYLDGELVPKHWRREVFTDPPWKEFPSVAFNEYGLASIAHGMGLQMDPDNEVRRNILYQVQLYGSIAIIYLRISVILTGLGSLLACWFTRFKKIATFLCISSIAICYILPPVMNIGLSILTIGFAEATNETGRYILINLCLSLAAISPLLLRLSPTEPS